MKSFVITTDEAIETSAKKLIESANMSIGLWHAVTDKDDVYKYLRSLNIKWKYPFEKDELDIKSGLQKRVYPTRVPEKRIACFLSHYMLWKECVFYNEPYFIFEQDAIFTRRISKEDFIILEDCVYDVISLNDPRGATRKSKLYDMKIKGSYRPVVPVPALDDNDFTIPHGLPGNSAYYIKPEGAKKLLELVDEHGAWPNDAIMCRQLMPGKLGCLRKYLTTIQPNLESTTSL